MRDEVIFIFRLHAMQRMIERSISKSEVKETIISGETIENYPEDNPYPSRLMLKIIKGKPIHVVYAINERNNIVITAYEPTIDKWEADYKTRKK